MELASTHEYYRIAKDIHNEDCEKCENYDLCGYKSGHLIEIKRNEIVKKKEAQKEQEENQSRIRDAQIERSIEIRNAKHIRSLELSMLREKEQKLKEQKVQFKMKENIEKVARNKEISNNVRFSLGTRRSFKPLSCNPYQKAEKKQMVTPQEWVKQRDLVNYQLSLDSINLPTQPFPVGQMNQMNPMNPMYQMNSMNPMDHMNHMNSMNHMNHMNHMNSMNQWYHYQQMFHKFLQETGSIKSTIPFLPSSSDDADDETESDSDLN
ncbi:hypothetical protein ACTFIZ_000543 [Dictyostelium cf. discoideum]